MISDSTAVHCALCNERRTERGEVERAAEVAEAANSQWRVLKRKIVVKFYGEIEPDPIGPTLYLQ